MSLIDEFKNTLKESKKEYCHIRDWVSDFESYDYDEDELIDFTRFIIKKLIKFNFKLNFNFELNLCLTLLEKIRIHFIYEHFSNHHIINLFMSLIRKTKDDSSNRDVILFFISNNYIKLQIYKDFCSLFHEKLSLILCNMCGNDFVLDLLNIMAKNDEYINDFCETYFDTIKYVMNVQA